MPVASSAARRIGGCQPTGATLGCLKWGRAEFRRIPKAKRGGGNQQRGQPNLQKLEVLQRIKMTHWNISTASEVKVKLSGNRATTSLLSEPMLNYQKRICVVRHRVHVGAPWQAQLRPPSAIRTFFRTCGLWEAYPELLNYLPYHPLQPPQPGYRQPTFAPIDTPCR